jgi:hypothetical protein
MELVQVAYEPKAEIISASESIIAFNRNVHAMGLVSDLSEPFEWQPSLLVLTIPQMWRPSSCPSYLVE